MSKNKAPAAAAVPGRTPAKIAIFSSVAVGMTILDQVTKVWVRNNLEERTDRIVVVDDFFNIIHAENPGAAFGFLNDSPYRMWVFAAFTAVALVVLFRMFLELPDEDRFQNIALGMIVSGAIGNAIDRLLYQSVTDMIDMYVVHDSLGPWLRERFGTTHWPTYNIADVAIVVGLIMFLIHALFLEKDPDEVEHAPPARPLSEDRPPESAAAAHAPGPKPAAPAAATEPPTETATEEFEPVSPATEALLGELETSDLDGGTTEMLEPVEVEDFEDQKTEALVPVSPPPSKKRNLADLGKP